MKHIKYFDKRGILTFSILSKDIIIFLWKEIAVKNLRIILKCHDLDSILHLRGEETKKKNGKS